MAPMCSAFSPHLSTCSEIPGRSLQRLGQHDSRTNIAFAWPLRVYGVLCPSFWLPGLLGRQSRMGTESEFFCGPTRSSSIAPLEGYPGPTLFRVQGRIAINCHITGLAWPPQMIYLPGPRAC